MLMVFLLCVMSTNCVCTLISFTSSVKRPILASSSGASTSSRIQKGLGAYWKIPTSNDNAVSAFSPPESSNTFCSFLPGGEATTSMPPSAEQLTEGQLEVLVDLMERFLELLSRYRVDFLDSGDRILDRVNQILTLGFEESMPFRRFLVFLKRHHVDRTHVVEAGAHLAINLVFRHQLLARDDPDRGVGHQFVTLHAQIVQARLCHVLRIRLQFRRRSGQFATTVARLVQSQPGAPQCFVDFS